MPGFAMDFDAVSHAASHVARSVGMGPRSWFEVDECASPRVAAECAGAASRFAAAVAALDASLLALHDGARSAVTVAYEADQAVARTFAAVASFRV